MRSDCKSYSSMVMDRWGKNTRYLLFDDSVLVRQGRNFGNFNFGSCIHHGWCVYNVHIVYTWMVLDVYSMIDWILGIRVYHSWEKGDQKCVCWMCVTHTGILFIPATSSAALCVTLPNPPQIMFEIYLLLWINIYIGWTYFHDAGCVWLTNGCWLIVVVVMLLLRSFFSLLVAALIDWCGVFLGVVGWWAKKKREIFVFRWTFLFKESAVNDDGLLFSHQSAVRGTSASNQQKCSSPVNMTALCKTIVFSQRNRGTLDSGNVHGAWQLLEPVQFSVQQWWSTVDGARWQSAVRNGELTHDDISSPDIGSTSVVTLHGRRPCRHRRRLLLLLLRSGCRWNLDKVQRCER